MLNECRALVVRDKNAPTMQQLEERRREREDLQWAQEAAREKWWAWMNIAMLIATCAFTVAILFDVPRNRHDEPAQLGADPANSLPPPTPEEPNQERSFDFDDPSPITERMAFLHLIRYGGSVDILDTDARGLRNRITEEQVLTVGQLRRYEVMLDLHDKRIDDSVPEKLPRDVVETVMHDLRK